MGESLLLGLLGNFSNPQSSDQVSNEGIENGLGDNSNPADSESGSVLRTAMPEFNVAPGVFSEPTSISLSTETIDANIYYTLNDTEPEPGSPDTYIYENPLPIQNIAGLTLRAKSFKSGYEEGDEISGIFSMRTLRTGQTTSYQPGDDGDLQPGGDFNFTVPTQHSIYDNDYTTTDNYTGLVWKTCREGRNGSTCNSGATNFTLDWHQAISSCEALNHENDGNGYAGRTDWRLPEFRELESLYRYNMGGNPTFSPVGFPNANQGSSFVLQYWTNTLSNRFGNDYAMVLEFRGNNGGTVMFTSTQFSYGQLVRCVAGSSRVTNTPSFIDNGDSTIYDRVSGLTWTKCAASQDINNNCAGGSGGFVWNDGLAHCNQLTQENFAGRSWRLPTIRELITVFRPENSSSPRTYTEFFPNTMQAYWSSTTRANNSGEAWIVQFSDSRVNTMSKTTAGIARTRCVAVD
ncbi:Lcl domain-containing protein [Leptospira sp. GIMC2001]|uniref:Lcl domain-containing protein n=1 Tax=Leptospira sp. GIMC2001 TaxID=1513297 RepID=UPI00234A4E78|nr:DUF1566 domain-containing protein [Leptospira sp. GIMC2001]WCL47734.1 DUF1566 domain-containing protein [Leptospira sp. GIMC2001]